MLSYLLLGTLHCSEGWQGVEGHQRTQERHLSVPAMDQRADSMAYLEKHKIPRLLEILGVKLAQQVEVCLTYTWEIESFLRITFEQPIANLIYMQKPASPNDFIIEELTNIAESKSKKQPVGVATTWAVQVYSCLAS